MALVAMLASWLVLSLLSSTMARTLPCTEPGEAELLQQYAKYITEGELHESFYQTELLRHKTDKHIDTPTGDPIESRADLDRDDRLDRQKAICPWVYEQKVNRQLFPSVVGQAVGTPTCAEVSGTYRNSACTCMPINMMIRVLKKSNCVNGKYEYKPTWQKITVGFAAQIPDVTTS